MPFDPNGMVMDFLRSCSSQAISFVEHDPTQQALATWYVAAPTALVFPTEHAFGSPVWDTVHPTATTLGFDATTPRVYYNGRRTNASDGTTFAGTASFFQIGAPSRAPLERGVNETPVECLRAPFGIVTGGLCVPIVPAGGGLRTGGSCTAPVAVATTLRYWSWFTPPGAPSSVRFTVSSGPFGTGTVYGQAISGGPNTFVLTNTFGFSVYRTDMSFGGLGAGFPTGVPLWITLDQAVATNALPVYWDESSGPASGQNSGIGVVPSESWQILDATGGVMVDNVVSMAFNTQAYAINFGFQTTNSFTLP